MSDSDFFSGIVQTKALWGDGQAGLPVFYHDVASLIVFMLAHTQKVSALLPSARMSPYRVTPWHSPIVISAYEYRDSDVGPYNEVSIGVPVVLDRASPRFVGLLRKAPSVPMVYVHRLPVTSEPARAAGVALAGFPKFLADITFAREGETLRCHVNAAGKHVLTLTGRQTPLKSHPRTRIDPITCTDDRLLRLELIMSERQAGLSRTQTDVHLELGEHPVAQELRDLQLGRMLEYQFCPRHQAILTSVCESYTR